MSLALETFHLTKMDHLVVVPVSKEDVLPRC